MSIGTAMAANIEVVTIVGARPQFIKAAAVSRAFAACESVNEVIVHTGQHYDANMSSRFFAELDIPQPAYHLGVGSTSHGAQTGRMLEAIEQVLQDERPDWVLVYGDTNSTLAGALAASKLHIPIAHIEAGLRSFNRRMPEEINRVLTDHISDILFAPSRAAVANLENEGLPAERIENIGDVMQDVADYYADSAEKRSRILDDLGLQRGQYVLSTLHRAENTDDPNRLRAIIDAFSIVSKEITIVLPLHPRTRAILQKLDWMNRLESCARVVEPVGYLDMILLEKNAALVATDSGGVQKEAFFHRVPCVTLRDETEWTELVDLGWNHVVPPRNAADIAQAILDSLGQIGHPGRPYGDGHASQKIACTILRRPSSCGSVTDPISPNEAS